MLIHIKRCLILLVALPFAAAADPVSVTSRSTGMLTPSYAATFLGLPQSDSPLPYELTVRSIIDPNAPGTDMVDNEQFGSRHVIAIGSNLDIWLTIGTSSYHYSGTGNTNLTTRQWDQYQHFITFNPPEAIGNVYFMIDNTLVAPRGTFADYDPLSTRTVEYGPGMTYASTDFAVYPVNPDATWSHRMGAIVQTYSLQVSPVPEPASLGMLLAGVLALGWWRRLRRDGICRLHTGGGVARELPVCKGRVALDPGQPGARACLIRHVAGRSVRAGCVAA